MSKKHARLSASGSAKWLNCAGSVEAEEKFLSENKKFLRDNFYTEEGTFAHELADICLRNYESAEKYIGQSLVFESDGKKMSAIVSEEMADFVQEYLDYVLSYETKNTQLFSEEKVDFSSAVPDGFGTVDSAIVDFETGICHIFDFKYGKGVKVDAFENTQAQLYALGFYNEFSFLNVIKSFEIHIIQPRMYNYSSWALSLEELKDFSKYAAERAEIALKGDAPKSPGEKQCLWCLAKPTCKSLKNYTEKTIISKFENLNLMTVNKLDDIDLKQILDNKMLIEKFLKSVEEHVFNRLLNGDKFEGYKLVEGRSNRQWSDGAEEILKSNLGEDAYKKQLIGITVAEKKLTKDEIQKITFKPKGKAKLVRASEKGKEIETTLDFFNNV